MMASNLYFAHFIAIISVTVFPVQKFLFYVLKSSEVLEVLVPILFHLNEARADQCQFWRSAPRQVQMTTLKIT